MSAALPSAHAAAVRRPRRALRFTRDDELVRLLRAGDERAFEAIYDRHHRGVLSFARHMLGSREEAEDAVQHAFIAAHRDLVGTDKPIQLKPWLYAITRNRCLSLLRGRHEERALEDVPEPAVEGLASEVQRRQDLRDLLLDLQRLPEDQRAALVLAELGALSHEEIGTALGVRKDKVKALVFQARESLASSRDARDADCDEIQQQIAVLRGGSLRRTQLRRHVEVCPSCAAFKAEVQRQRTAMAMVLPVAPTLALKPSIIAAVIGGGGGAGGGIIGGGLLAAASGKGLVAKVATIAVVAGGAAGGGLVAVDEISGGGEGGTATAKADIPSEGRAVKLVGDLRERARQTADKRQADRQVARASGDSASSIGRPAVARVKPERRKRSGRRAERRGADVQVPVAAVAPESAPGPGVAPASAPARPAKGRGHGKGRYKGAGHPGNRSGGGDERRSGDQGSDRSGKGKGHGKGKGKGHEKVKGDGHRKQGEAPGVTLPAARPAPSKPNGRGDKGRGAEKAIQREVERQQKAIERAARKHAKGDRGPQVPAPPQQQPNLEGGGGDGGDKAKGSVLGLGG